MKEIRKFLLLSFFIGFTSLLFAQGENSWTKKSSFGGLKREKAIAFSIGEFGYIGCGVDTAEFVHNDLWQFDPGLNSWTQKASMPGVARRDAAAFVAAGKGYVGTGFSHDDGDLGIKLKDFWRYNPADNTWEGIADYPGGGDTGIYQASSFSANDRGYIVCGKIGSNAYIAELWQYNPETEMWIERTPFPGGERYQLTSFTIHNKAFVGLGTDHDVFRKDMHVYDPVTNTWDDLDDFPGTARAKSSSFSIGNKGFVIFGVDGGFKDELWEYDITTNAWNTRAPFPGGARTNAIAFSIGDKGYAGIGKESDGKKQSFYEYRPAGPLAVAEELLVEALVYPNPIQHSAIIQLSSPIYKGKMSIIDLSGRLVYSTPINSAKVDFERNDLEVGTYLLIIQDEHSTILLTKNIVLI